MRKRALTQLFQIFFRSRTFGLINGFATLDFAYSSAEIVFTDSRRIEASRTDGVDIAFKHYRFQIIFHIENGRINIFHAVGNRIRTVTFAVRRTVSEINKRFAVRRINTTAFILIISLAIGAENYPSVKARHSLGEFPEREKRVRLDIIHGFGKFYYRVGIKKRQRINFFKSRKLHFPDFLLHKRVSVHNLYAFGNIKIS